MSQADHHYRPDIDGLRAAAVAFVLAFHAFPALLPGGFVGVDIFFVISGYLISGIILAGIADRRFTLTGFYARRIRRIFPALIAVLAVLLAAGWLLLYADDFARLGHHAAAGAAFISNFAFWQEASYFDVAADLKPLLHLWSLGVEEQFYLVWPVLLLLASRWKRGALAATLTVGAMSFLLAIWTVRLDRTPAFYAPWNRFWELLAGAVLACIEADEAMRAWLRNIMSRRWASELAAVSGAAGIVAGIVLIDSTRVFPGLWVALPVGGAFLLMLAGPQAWINRVVLSNRAVVFVGLISYPLYLWHWPLLSMAHIVRAAPPTTAERLALLTISAALATATFYVIERPIRFGVRRRGTVAGLAVAMSVVAAAAFAVRANDGFIDRPVNRGDAAALVDYYDRLHNYGLAAAYRSECDFMDWNAPRVRESIDPSCTVAGERHTIFLWGDSHAQALTAGLRDSLPPGVSLAQVTTSACAPQIDNFDLSVEHRRCEITNLYAMDAIRRLRPAVVILAQQSGHDHIDWRSIAARARELGAGHVVVVGPTPVWQPSLPRVYAEHHMIDRAAYVSDGLDVERLASDRTVAAALRGAEHITYVSLLDQLCRDGACLARIGDPAAIDLMVVDAGHLSPKGSAYLGPVIWQPLFTSLLQ